MKKYYLLLVCFLIVYLRLIAQDALKAEYYNGIDFQEFVGEQTVSNIDFYWDRHPPIEGVNPNYCSVRYTGQLKAPRAGLISFAARVDDGIRVWLDDKILIDNWQLNDVGYSDGEMYMEANKKYNLKIEYFNGLNEAELRLLWKLPEDPKQSWLSKWWYGDDLVVIPMEYYSPAVVEEDKPEALPLPDQDLVAKSPKPKPKPKPKPVPIQKQEPIVEPPPSPSPSAYEEYIPKTIEFEQAKSEILEVSHTDLNKLAGFLVKNATRKVKIEGHTDYVGDADKNLVLSERRAKAVAAYLIKQGVSSKQIIHAIGYGGSRPLVKSKYKKHHPENRRVEFIIE